MRPRNPQRERSRFEPGTDQGRGTECRRFPGAISPGWPARAARRVGVVASWRTFAIAQGAAKVVIVGGGAGGATVAHYVKKGAPELDVTLIEANPIYSSSFFSNLYHRRLPHPGVPQSRLRRPAQARHQGGARLRHRRRYRQEDGQDAGRPHATPTTGWCCRPASTSSTTRSRATRARRRAHHAARLQHGGGRQAPAQAAAAAPCATAARWRW